MVVGAGVHAAAILAMKRRARQFRTVVLQNKNVGRLRTPCPRQNPESITDDAAAAASDREETATNA